MLFKSSYPDIEIPSKLALWPYLFEDINSNSNEITKDASAPTFINATTTSSLSHSDVKTFSTYLSSALIQDLGLQPGEVISICATNSIWYPVALFGAICAGIIPALSSPAYGLDEMLHALGTVRSSAIICDSTALPNIRLAASKLSIASLKIVIIDAEITGFKSLKSMLELGKQLGQNQVLAYKIPEEKLNSEICSVLCFSSGTTGLPKAVMISHQNIIAQCMQLLLTTSPDHKTILGLLPFYHSTLSDLTCDEDELMRKVTGVVKLLAFPLVIKANVVILPTFTMPTLLSTISKYKIAEVQMVPPLLIRLVHDPTVANYDLTCIKRFASGAAPISPEVLSLLQAKFPGRGFKQGYGMTESCGCISTHPLDMHDFKFARTGGTLVANTLVKVVDQDGREVGVGEKGEILAKGPQMVMGYFNNPAATAGAFDNEGFLRTGDEGSIDSVGLVIIHDRIKEMIKVKGIQVAPAELEDLLLGHEKVEDCAVIGIPDDYSGERPLGFVVLKPAIGRVGVEEELVEWVKQKKVRAKWLVGIRIVHEIPKSASGKILRRILKEKHRLEVRNLKPKL